MQSETFVFPFLVRLAFPSQTLCLVPVSLFNGFLAFFLFTTRFLRETLRRFVTRRFRETRRFRVTRRLRDTRRLRETRLRDARVEIINQKENIRESMYLSV